MYIVGAGHGGDVAPSQRLLIHPFEMYFMPTISTVEASFKNTGIQESKDIRPVPPKEDQSWVFIGKTDTKAETPVLWPLHAKS